MPKIQGDFSQISSSFDPLPDGEYECIVKSVEETETKENKLPMLKFTLEVDDPNHPELAGRLLFDNIVTVDKKGGPSKMGLGRLKAYAEATLGEEEANSPDGIDTDEMIDSKVLAVVKLRSWTKENPDGSPGETGTSNDIKKVLSVD